MVLEGWRRNGKPQSVVLKVGDVMESQSVGLKVGDVMERTKCGPEGWRRNAKAPQCGAEGYVANLGKKEVVFFEGWRRNGKNKWFFEGWRRNGKNKVFP